MLTFVAPSLRVLRSLMLASAVICMLAPALYAQKSKTGFTAFIVGNAADAPPAATLTPGLALMGGGTDVDAAFQWMCQRAGGGDFVVIRTTGTDAYNPYIQELCPQMDSVETIIITSVAGANSAYVSSHIQNAEALWIAGGDQLNVRKPVARNSGANRCKFSSQFEARACWRNQRGFGCAQPIHLHRRTRLGDFDSDAGQSFPSLRHNRSRPVSICTWCEQAL